MSESMDFNWIENHDERITDLERWREKHDASMIQNITEFNDVKYTIKRFEEHINDQKTQNKQTNDKLGDVSGMISKILISTLTTVALILLKFVFDLLNKKI